MSEVWLKVLFNDTLVLKVGKQKAVQNSEYFEKMLKPFYIDCQSNMLKLNFPSSGDNVKKVMSYIDTGQICLSKNNVLEVFSISCYLQCKTLEKLCLEYFIKHLHVDHVESQLKPFLNDITFYEFRQIETEFRKTKRKTYSGIYIIELMRNRFGFKMLSEGSNEVCQLIPPKLKVKGDYGSLVTLANKVYLIGLYDVYQYDLIKGIWNNLKYPEESYTNIYINSVLCTYNDNLYIFKLEIKATGNFCLVAVEYTPSEKKWNEIKRHTFACKNKVILDYVLVEAGIFYVLCLEYQDQNYVQRCALKFSLDTREVSMSKTLSKLFSFGKTFLLNSKGVAFVIESRASFGSELILNIAIKNLETCTSKLVQLSWPNNLKQDSIQILEDAIITTNENNLYITYCYPDKIESDVYRYTEGDIVTCVVCFEYIPGEEIFVFRVKSSWSESRSLYFGRSEFINKAAVYV